MCLNNDKLEILDTIFINGNVYSIDKNDNIYEAMGIKDGRILSLGSNEEVLKRAGEHTNIFDLKQQTVIPAFIDAHASIPQKNMISDRMISLFDCKNTNEYIKKIKSYIKDHPDQEIIYGIGIKAEIILDEEWINNIDNFRVIVLRDCKGEILYLNKKAVEFFKIENKDINDDFYRKGASKDKINSATLKGNDINLVPLEEHFKFKDKEYINAFIKYQESAQRCGITTVNLTENKSFDIPIEIYRRLQITNKLKLRISYGVKIYPSKVCNKTINEQIHEMKRKRIIYKTDIFDVSHADFTLDGSIESKMSYLFKPYRNEYDRSYNGTLLWNIFELGEGIKMSNRLDFNTEICANGDNACKVAIDSVEYSARNNENHNYRNSIVNLNLVTKYYIRRMKVLNINAIISPFWFYMSIESSRAQVNAIGSERAHRLYPFKSLLDQGIITAGASSYYVEDNPSPIKAVGCAVCRNLYDYDDEYDFDGKFDMTDFKYGLNPCERVTVLDAIRAFTINAAYVLGIENEVGSLEKGKKADFIILDKNIFDVKPLDISKINVIKTYFNGECVYNSKEN